MQQLHRGVITLDQGAQWLAESFVELAAGASDGVDVDRLLALLVERGMRVLGADEGVAFLAGESGRPRPVASSSERSGALLTFELTVGQGPCVGCYRSQEQRVNIRLRGADVPWPTYAAMARGVGLSLAHALPLRVAGQAAGAVGLFHAGEEPVDGTRAALAQALVDVAGIGLAARQRVGELRALADQLQTALDSRVLIEQAKGAVAARAGISPAQAFTLLRDHARDTNRTLRSVARAAIEGDLEGFGLPAVRPRPPRQPQRAQDDTRRAV